MPKLIGYKWTDFQGRRFEVKPEGSGRDEPPMDLAQWLMLTVVMLLAVIGYIVNDVR